MITLEEFTEDVAKYDLDISKIINISVAFLYANGCGAKGGMKFPSTMWFVSIIAACIIHDIDWALAKCYQDLLDGNERFDNNLKKICDKESLYDITRWARRMRIAKYVNGVELHGTESYAKERGFDRRL